MTDERADVDADLVMRYLADRIRDSLVRGEHAPDAEADAFESGYRVAMYDAEYSMVMQQSDCCDAPFPQVAGGEWVCGECDGQLGVVRYLRALQGEAPRNRGESA